jgi:hypothetical protein
MSKKQKTKKTNSAKLTNHQSNELEIIAKKMDEISRRRLPDGVIRCGVLKGLEPEIRQEALIMSVGGFLQQNTDYIDADQKHDDAAVKSSMEKCMAIALAIVKIRMTSRLTHELARTHQLTEENGGTRQHPSQIQPSDWSSDVKSFVIMRSVAKAVHQGKLSVSNASIVSMICEHGMPAEEVALAVGISRSAVYQQVWRVRRVLPEVMNQVEIHIP